jgi:hypothetical protein
MTPHKYKVLRGLEGLRVIVEEIDLPGAPVIEAGLQRDVELMLEQADVPLFTTERWLQTPGAPYLYVNITATRLQGQGLRSFSLDLELHQQTHLARNPEVTISSCTWERGLIDMVPEEQLLEELGPALCDLVAVFIDDYWAANTALQFN